MIPEYDINNFCVTPPDLPASKLSGATDPCDYTPCISGINGIQVAYNPTTGKTEVDGSLLANNIIILANHAALPAIGTVGKVYLILDDDGNGNNATYIWNAATNTYEKVLEVLASKKYRTAVTNLVAGSNTITHNLNLNPTPTVVQIRDATTGAEILARVPPSGETANTVDIVVPAAVSNVVITVFG